jgi:putative endonuclease
MPFFVYIIQSDQDGSFYKGSSQVKRLLDHNRGLSMYTSTKIPWKLVYVEELNTKREMLIREKKLKRGNAKYNKHLNDSDKNIARNFI